MYPKEKLEFGDGGLHSRGSAGRMSSEVSSEFSHSLPMSVMRAQGALQHYSVGGAVLTTWTIICLVFKTPVVPGEISAAPERVMFGISGKGFSGSRGLEPARSLYRADRLALYTGDLYTAKLTKIAERTQRSTRLRVKRVASKKARAAWGSQKTRG
jgi:hypothetical protein